MIYLIAYALFCISFAYLNWYLIEVKDLDIYHGANGGLHIVAAIAGGYYFGWQIGVAVLFVARVVFDVALNLFRGKAIDYVSPSPKSIVDKIEKKLFKQDGVTPKIIYILIVICLATIKL